MIFQIFVHEKRVSHNIYICAREGKSKPNGITIVNFDIHSAILLSKLLALAGEDESTYSCAKGMVKALSASLPFKITFLIDGCASRKPAMSFGTAYFICESSAPVPCTLLLVFVGEPAELFLHR